MRCSANKEEEEELLLLSVDPAFTAQGLFDAYIPYDGVSTYFHVDETSLDFQNECSLKDGESHLIF